MKILMSIFLMFVCCFSSPPLSAQEVDERAFLDLDIPALADLEIENSSISINLTEGTGVDAFNNGFVDGPTGSPTLTVSSNTPWTLSINLANRWNLVDGYRKAEGDLQVRFNTDGPLEGGFTQFTSLSRTPVIMAQDTGSGANRIEYEAQYRVLLDWTKDIPGEYSVNILHTLSTEG